MTIAQNFIKVFEQLERDGRTNKRTELSDRTFWSWRESAKKIDYPLGTDSYDSTERWMFRDNSSVVVSNPKEITYYSFLKSESVCPCRNSSGEEI